jgi:uncharacterized membrane protein
MKHILAFLLVLVSVVALHAQSTPLSTGTYTLNTTTSATSAIIAGNATLTTANAQVLPIHTLDGVALWPSITAIGAETGNVTFTYELSPDNSTWSTTGPVSQVLDCTGNTTKTSYLTLAPPHPTAAQAVSNARYIKLKSIAVGAVTNATISIKYSRTK